MVGLKSTLSFARDDLLVKLEFLKTALLSHECHSLQGF